MFSAQPEFIFYDNREERSFGRIAMVVTFPDDNKLKTDLHCFKLHRSYTVSFNLSAKFSGVESERNASLFRKRKREFVGWVHLLHKTGV